MHVLFISYFEKKRKNHLICCVPYSNLYIFCVCNRYSKLMTRRMKWNGDDDSDESDSDDDGHYSNQNKAKNRKGNFCDLVWTGKVSACPHRHIDMNRPCISPFCLFFFLIIFFFSLLSLHLLLLYTTMISYQGEVSIPSSSKKQTQLEQHERSWKAREWPIIGTWY